MNPHILLPVNPHVISHDAIPKIIDWLRNRGGIFIWNSINLSNPDKELITPAKDQYGQPYTKPSWEMSNTPSRHITDTRDIKVSIDKEVKRFHVAVRQSGNGLSLKVTDGGTRRVRNEVEKAGPGAYYTFDYSDYNNAVIMAPEKQILLSEYIVLHNL